MSKETSLVPFVNINSFDRVRTSVALLNARDSITQDLRRELPYADRVYQSPIKAYRRIGHVAAQMRMGKIDAHVAKSGSKTQGVATRMLMGWNTQSTNHNNYEISYWVRKQPSENVAVDIGTSIVSFLLSQNVYADTQWMVTLLDDRIKQQVCEANGMVAVGAPQLYDIEDGVILDRQLWVK